MASKLRSKYTLTTRDQSKTPKGVLWNPNGDQESTFYNHLHLVVSFQPLFVSVNEDKE